MLINEEADIMLQNYLDIIKYFENYDEEMRIWAIGWLCKHNYTDTAQKLILEYNVNISKEEKEKIKSLVPKK